MGAGSLQHSLINWITFSFGSCTSNVLLLYESCIFFFRKCKQTDYRVYKTQKHFQLCQFSVEIQLQMKSLKQTTSFASFKQLACIIPELHTYTHSRDIINLGAILIKMHQ